MLTGWLTPAIAVRIAAALGLIGVGLGAFGAHGLKDLLTATDRLETWQTAVLYQLVHAVAMLAIALRAPLARGPFTWFLIGVLIFSGSLYLLSVTGVRWLGAITPLGGVAFLVGWVWLLIRG
jgi:uncharacterized membrane protein YgdD (TMEM256/DUF423 family)